MPSRPPGEPRIRTFVAVFTVVLIVGGSAGAQDLEPRAYSPSPIGTTFIIISTTRSSGGVFTDPVAPITDVETTIGILGLTMGHTFDLFGRQALLLGVVPVTWGKASGEVLEAERTVTRRGVADPRVRLSVILAGPRAMTPAEFIGAPRRTAVGVSLTAVPPLGQYDSAKLVNLGSHRWAFKPEIGLSHPAGRWTFDVYGGVWLFTANEEYYPGSSRRQQDPVVALQAHVGYALGRRAWIAFNGTWYTGGRSTINAVDRTDLQRNTRVGATFAAPFGSSHSLKIAYSAGVATRIGADFRTFSIAWQVLLLR
jgi:hypothetical protein